MRLIFGETVLDDDTSLNDYNICEGSELNLVLLPPKPIRSTRASRSRSRSRSRRRSRSPSRPLRDDSPTRVYSLRVCREV